MKKNSISKTFLSLLCTAMLGLNANAMEQPKAGNDFMIKNLNNYKKEDFDKFKFSGYINDQNKSNNDFMIENLNNYEKKDFGNIEFVGHKGSPKKSDVSLRNNVENNSGDYEKIDIPKKISQKSLKELKPDVNNKPCSNDAIAFKFNFANNFLVIADTKDRMQKVTSLLCNNNLDLSLGNLRHDFNNYQSGRVYKTLNNPNIRILCVTLDDFINNSFDNYDWGFICQNTSKIFYIFKCDSTHDEKSFEKLQKFYHKFNKHWCGDDFAYNENYDPDFNSIWEPNFSKKPLAKGRNDWFEYIRVKRGLDDHRYIVFVLDNNKINYPFKLGHYVSKMPDARSINTKELNVDFNIKVLLDALCMEYYGTPQKVILFTNDNIKKKNTVARWFDNLWNS